MTSCPLDALLTRGLISQDNYNDASDYRRWYTTAVRKGTISAPGGSVGGEPVDDSKIADASRKFKAAAAVLMRVSRAAKDALDNTVIYERWPHIFTEGKPRKSDDNLFDAFRALTEWRRGERRAA